MSISLATLFRRQRGRCFYCDGETFLPTGRNAWSDATREHLKRKADGGEDIADNLVMACLCGEYCNSHRGAVPADLYREAMQALAAAGRHPVNRDPIRAQKKTA